MPFADSPFLPGASMARRLATIVDTETDTTPRASAISPVCVAIAACCSRR